MRWSAGFFGGIGSRPRKGNVLPPPGLGSEETQEDHDKEEEERFSQVGARIERGERKRHGASRRH